MIKIQHPAAKLLVMASDMQEKEIGDGTNFVIIFGGQLLQNAAELLNMVNYYLCKVLFMKNFLNIKIIFRAFHLLRLLTVTILP